jgi:hypothetical protein
VKKDGEKQIWRLSFIAAGAGLGFGISVGGPFTVQISMPYQPGGGFNIYRNPLHRSAFGHRKADLAVLKFYFNLIQVRGKPRPLGRGRITRGAEGSDF